MRVQIQMAALPAGRLDDQHPLSCQWATNAPWNVSHLAGGGTLNPGMCRHVALYEKHPGP
eukprot:m.1497307 g.1497307  ORF g.1497307 m.1497307 type:complete len:60 (+) comp25198_c0_seq13:670-849(+)